MVSFCKRAVMSVAVILLSRTAGAAVTVPAADTGDTAWMLAASLLVLMMTVPGVALFYGGMVRRKNVLATVMHSYAITCLGAIIWMTAGYSLAFSGDGALIGNLSRLLLAGTTPGSLTGTIPESVFIVFQMTFAIIAGALITGAVAERMKFSAILAFVGLWLLGVYVPIAHWVWGGGFLGGAGVLDFAGGTVVHINAGVAGLVAARIVGPRIGFGRENLAPHNLVLTVTGGALLWAGWFGFNAGSALSAGAAAGMAMLVTQIAAAAGGLAWMSAEWMVHEKPSVLGIVSGTIAGLVAITPAAGYVGPGAALVIGLAAGLASLWGVAWLKPRLGLDDSLDVFAVHGVAGIVGALLTGLLASAAVGGTAGALEGNWPQLGRQAYGVLVTVLYSAAASWVLLKLIDRLIGLRVSGEAEREGLDVSAHGESLN